MFVSPQRRKAEASIHIDVMEIGVPYGVVFETVSPRGPLGASVTHFTV